MLKLPLHYKKCYVISRGSKYALNDTGVEFGHLKTHGAIILNRGGVMRKIVFLFLMLFVFVVPSMAGEMTERQTKEPIIIA